MSFSVRLLLVEETYVGLFPYALDALSKTLAEKWEDPDFKTYRDAFPEADRASPENFEAAVKRLTEGDVKIGYLKDLQGYLWRTGYVDSSLSTPLFPDVPRVLRSWREQGLRLAIYSSGSVAAQKMLFAHVAAASEDSKNRPSDGGEETARKTTGRREDLNPLFERYFDTVIGAKTEPRSYAEICKEMAVGTDEVLFLSDNVNEIRAAQQSSLHAVVLDRPGNAPLSATDRAELTVARSLEDITIKPR